ncbi:expressed protein [Arabidopsis lyrata subsp. lyrata]|uniref:Expressed protein n=1 Tax=Arabidopsis lyrata subsp. lyrata TaxID=81972 RepID=D7KKR6_ARALL|nr:expressed protein [Arabidopsis lyrata subsp. lyrata]
MSRKFFFDVVIIISSDAGHHRRFRFIKSEPLWFTKSEIQVAKSESLVPIFSNLILHGKNLSDFIHKS